MAMILLLWTRCSLGGVANRDCGKCLAKCFEIRGANRDCGKCLAKCFEIQTLSILQEICEVLDHLVLSRYTGDVKPELSLVPRETAQEFWLPLQMFDVRPEAKNGCYTIWISLPIFLCLQSLLRYNVVLLICFHITDLHHAFCQPSCQLSLSAECAVPCPCQGIHDRLP